MPSSSVETECKKESKYRSLFTELMQKYAGVIQIGSSKSDKSSIDNDGNAMKDKNSNNFKEESKLIQNAISAERNAILTGVFVGVAAFTSFRYGPAYLVKRLGGEKKARALQEAEEASRKDSYGWIKRGVALSFETLFGLLVGTRGYSLASKEMMSTSNDSDQSDRSIFKDISRIPLVEGRSIVSESICDEWIDIAYNQIPRNFWKNVKIEQDNGKSNLKDPRAWTAIADFAINCQKRNAYSKMLQEKQRDSEYFNTALDKESKMVVIPSPGVPKNTPVAQDLFVDDNFMKITEKRADEIVSDQ